MCAGSDDAQAEARRQEAERQSRIRRSVAKINSAFAGRSGQYTDLGTALRERYMQELGRQQAVASRQSRFALARSGLTGGSAAIDATRLLAREGQQGTVAAEQKARSGVANLQSADEEARLRMISLAQSGNDIGNAASQTAASLRANLASAQNENLASGLGDIFGGTTQVYKNMQDAAARRRGLQDATIYAKPGER